MKEIIDTILGALYANNNDMELIEKYGSFPWLLVSIVKAISILLVIRVVLSKYELRSPFKRKCNK